MTIGERIRIKRKQVGLTVEQLAEKLGKDRATIYRYENGDIGNLPLTILEPLGKILKVHPSYFLMDNVETIPQITELTNKEAKLLINYNKLNDVGKKEAIKRIEELTQIDIYTDYGNLRVAEKSADYLTLNAAHEIECASEEDRQHDDDIMDDDNF